CAARRKSGATPPTSRPWPRALAPCAACVAAGLLYVAILRLSLRDAPAGVRGSAESLVTLGQLPGRVVYFLDVLWRRMVLKNFGAGALAEGSRQILSGGLMTLFACVLLVATGVLWWAQRGAAPVREPQPDSPPRPGPSDAPARPRPLWLG